jgi:hypothetical protein
VLSEPRSALSEARHNPKVQSHGSSLPNPDATSGAGEIKETRKDEKGRRVVIYQDSAEKRSRKPKVKPMTAEEKTLKKKT